MPTEAEIERKYKKLLEGVDDAEEKMNLELQKNKEIVSMFKEQAAEQREIERKKEIINQYPLAVLAEVRGDTAEELEAAAKASHERIEALVAEKTAAQTEEIKAKEAELADAKAAGWQGNSAGGGGAGGGGEEQDKYDFIDGAWKKLRDETISKPEADRLIKTRLGDKVTDAMVKAIEGH